MTGQGRTIHEYNQPFRPPSTVASTSPLGTLSAAARKQRAQPAQTQPKSAVPLSASSPYEEEKTSPAGTGKRRSGIQKELALLREEQARLLRREARRKQKRMPLPLPSPRVSSGYEQTQKDPGGYELDASLSPSTPPSAAVTTGCRRSPRLSQGTIRREGFAQEQARLEAREEKKRTMKRKTMATGGKKKKADERHMKKRRATPTRCDAQQTKCVCFPSKGSVSTSENANAKLAGLTFCKREPQEEGAVADVAPSPLVGSQPDTVREHPSSSHVPKKKRTPEDEGSLECSRGAKKRKEY